MNTANLQLEGLYIVLASLHELLIAKGVISRQELDSALQRAEQTAVNDYGLASRSDANRDAVAFSARLLQLASRGAGDGVIQPFAELARLVGTTKDAKPSSGEPEGYNRPGASGAQPEGGVSS